jgi:hypothetical protein
LCVLEVEGCSLVQRSTIENARCVWSRNLVNEEALARVEALRHRGGIYMKEVVLKYIWGIYVQWGPCVLVDKSLQPQVSWGVFALYDSIDFCCKEITGMSQIIFYTLQPYPCFLNRYYLCYTIKKNVMGRACGMYEGEVKTEWWWRGETWRKENTRKTYILWQGNIKMDL